jgi:phosphoketolase
MHRDGGDALDRLDEIRASSARRARARGGQRAAERPRWPMIVLRTPKGWTGPEGVDGKKVEGTWRAHQVPIADWPEAGAPALLEHWLRSYRPEELFDDRHGRAELAALAPRASGAWAPTRTPTAACCCATCAARLPRLRGRRAEPGAPKAKPRACWAASCAT